MKDPTMNEVSSGCRLCMRQSKNMKQLTTKWNDSIQFCEMLCSFANLDNIEEASQKICYLCEMLLISSYCFKGMCLESDKILKKQFSNKISEEHEKDKCKLLSNSNWQPIETIVEPRDCVSVAQEPIDDDDSGPHKSTVTIPETSKLDLNKWRKHLEDPLNCKWTSDTIDQNAESPSVLVKPIKTELDERAINPIVKLDIKAIRSAYSQGNYSCRKCKMRFKQVKDYKKHHAEMHRGSVLCNLCGKLVSKAQIKRHTISHTKTKEHVCTECGKTLMHEEDLKRHWRIHTGEKRYACEHCGECFLYWSTKTNHVRTVHTNEKRYECNICGKKFVQRVYLKRHMRRHTGELPHECYFCEKRFFDQQGLRNHMVVHTKEKNVICEICNKAFGTRKTMRTHMKIHTGERNYVCPVCEKAFTQAHVLRTHMKTHPDCPIPPAGVRLAQKVTSLSSSSSSNL